MWAQRVPRMGERQNVLKNFRLKTGKEDRVWET
jgi:hypothetical protein